LDDWIKQLDANGGKGTITWVVPTEFANEADKRAASEKQRRAQFEQVCKRTDDLTRGRVAERILGDEGLRLLSAVGAKHQVELVGFTQELWEAKPEQVATLFQSRPAALGTDLKLPLDRALQRAGAEQGELLGVILLTDGQHNWGTSPV